MLDHQSFIDAGLAKPGTSLRYPFGHDVPVLFVLDRMFALFGTHEGLPSANLKCDPEEAWFLREKYPRSIVPGYHMNKKHWNTVVLDGTILDSELFDMLEVSYQLVVRKLPKKLQLQLTT